MGKKLEIKPGDRYGRLTIVNEVEPCLDNRGRKIRRFLCKCDCGNKNFIARLPSLRNGDTTSCGCYNKEVNSKRFTKENKKYNKYDLETYDYGVGYTLKGNEFYFDKEDYNRIKDYCWFTDYKGYLVSKVVGTGSHVRMHRLILNAPKNKQVDHINGVKNDNRKENLRLVTAAENSMNKRVCKNNTSGFQGVCWNKNNNKWTAYIGFNNKHIHLGLFDDFESAVKARLDAEEKYFGEFSPNSDKFKKE